MLRKTAVEHFNTAAANPFLFFQRRRSRTRRRRRIVAATSAVVERGTSLRLSWRRRKSPSIDRRVRSGRRSSSIHTTCTTSVTTATSVRTVALTTAPGRSATPPVHACVIRSPAKTWTTSIYSCSSVLTCLPSLEQSGSI